MRPVISRRRLELMQQRLPQDLRYFGTSDERWTFVGTVAGALTIAAWVILLCCT